MSEHYTIGKSEDGAYVYVRDIQCAISLDLALDFTRDFTALGETSDARLCLIDVRGTTSIAGVMGKYEYAYTKAVTAGLTHRWRVALLKDASDSTHDFLPTVMGNAGHIFKSFENEDDAVRWLIGEDRSKASA